MLKVQCLCTHVQCFLLLHSSAVCGRCNMPKFRSVCNDPNDADWWWCCAHTSLSCEVAGLLLTKPQSSNCQLLHDSSERGLVIIKWMEWYCGGGLSVSREVRLMLPSTATVHLSCWVARAPGRLGVGPTFLALSLNADQLTYIYCHCVSAPPPSAAQSKEICYPIIIRLHAVYSLYYGKMKKKNQIPIPRQKDRFVNLVGHFTIKQEPILWYQCAMFQRYRLSSQSNHLTSARDNSWVCCMSYCSYMVPSRLVTQWVYSIKEESSLLWLFLCPWICISFAMWFSVGFLWCLETWLCYSARRSSGLALIISNQLNALALVSCARMDFIL